MAALASSRRVSIPSPAAQEEEEEIGLLGDAGQWVTSSRVLHCRRMYGFIACTFAVLLVAPALVAVSLQAAEQRSEAGRLATKPLRLPWGAERRFEQLASAKEPDSQELDGGSSDDPSSQTLGNAGTEMHESEKSLVTHAIGQLVGKVLGVFGVGGGGGDETEQKDKRLQQHQQQQKKQPRPDQKQQHPTDEERSNKASKERSSHVTEKDKEEDARAMAEAMARVRRERAKDVKHALAVAGMHKKQREQVAKQAEDAGEQVALEEKEKLERAQKQLERAKQQREAQRLERKERKEPKPLAASLQTPTPVRACSAPGRMSPGFATGTPVAPYSESPDRREASRERTRQNHSQCGRAAGQPLAPWRGYVGQPAV